jgi:hypothetical protein
VSAGGPSSGGAGSRESDPAGRAATLGGPAGSGGAGGSSASKAKKME